jgi:hypothetical protein
VKDTRIEVKVTKSLGIAHHCNLIVFVKMFSYLVVMQLFASNISLLSFVQKSAGAKL